MRRLATVLAMILTLLITPLLVAASDDLPRSFAGCVMEGGVVRAVEGELTCRLIRSSDFRIYGTATDECGEEVEVEIWGESRTGVVTWLLAPDRMVELPDVGMHDAWPPANATAIPCTVDSLPVPVWRLLAGGYHRS